MNIIKCVFIVFALLVSLGANAQSSVVAKGAKPVKRAGEFLFTEGPAADAQGNVYFTDQPNDKIWKWSVDGTVSLFLEHTGRSNGMYFDPAGNLVTTADLYNELWSFDKEKKATVILSGFEGQPFNGPNDLWIDARGGIYFTDAFYKRPYWRRSVKIIEAEDVYYLSPDKKTVRVAATGFVRPNGIVGTLDGKTLYIADINDRKTYSFAIGTDGTLSNRRLFTEMGSDGMTVDRDGHVYLTGKGITVFDSSGKQIEQIQVDEPWTANVCFGGKDFKTLFITASKSVYTLEMSVKGRR
jgi:gluconolactonase